MPVVKLPLASTKQESAEIEVDLHSDSDATIEPDSDDTENIPSKPKAIKIVKARTVRRKVRPEVEKIVYLVEKDDGEIIPEPVRPPPKLSKRELKKLEIERQAVQEEIEKGKRLTRLKNGKVDKRTKIRSPAQTEATRKMVEANKARRDAKRAAAIKEQNQVIEKSVKSTLVKAITDPKSLRDAHEASPPQPVKSRAQLARDLLG
jgi:hypothetical protein